MCKDRGPCTLLAERAAWSRRAPLPPPDYMWAPVRHLATAVDAAANDRIAEARQLVASLPSAEIEEWWSTHAQRASRTRVVDRRRVAGKSATGSKRMPNDAEKRAVWQRDSYSCRYCGLPVIPREVLKAFGDAIGADRFPMGRANKAQHGLALLTWAQVDHVLPFSSGGATDTTNIVTACSACNFGKGRFTVDELGIDDPRDHEPVASAWDGLHSLLPALKSRAAGGSTRPST